ncbi:protein tamozhennic [Athalia rosae]|uniref:protein tamozhennic n=1 Tax=Athalia rosae TaxID=37344 RepID=UPI002033BBC6|nr:protein tamozhennic [Athalia rosae]XP_020707083.2 protein tamozhennic [Athalia rosae]
MAEDLNGRSRDRLHDIRIKLEQSHLVYLQTDDSPLKLQHRQKLEGFIKEYLCLVPNDNKYVFQDTADVLHSSAASMQDFSGYRACNAWNAIALYAANLLAQPWRKEYKNLKTYSGYWKHEVDANIIGGEWMFEVMGYRLAGLRELTLEGPIDPDKVSNVSRDAIVAFVECQILKQIWESVSQNFTISWLEVLEFRENHVGTPEQAIRALNYRFLEKVHHNRVKTSTYRDYHQLPLNTLDLISSSPYNFPPNSYNTYSPQYPITGYKHFNDNHAPPMNLQHVQSVDPNSGNRCNIYGHPRVDSKYFSGINANEYCAPVSNYAARVPIGQLIELDTPMPVINHQNKDNKKIVDTILHYTRDFDEPDSSKSVPGDLNNYEYAKVEKKPLKAPPGGNEKDSFSSWDFVYRNLESLGYSKDLGDREDVLHKRESDLYRIRQKPIKETINNQEEKYTFNHSDKRRVHSNFEGLDRLAANGRVSTEESFLPQKKSSFDDLNKELRDRTHQERSNVIDMNKKYSQTLPSQHKHRSVDPVGRVSDSMRNLGLDKNHSRSEKQPKWQCSTCTFLNVHGKDICEMCGKSRRKGNEDKPLASGGKECPHCTLVNERNVSNCDACGASLKDSPTYI